MIDVDSLTRGDILEFRGEFAYQLGKFLRSDGDKHFVTKATDSPKNEYLVSFIEPERWFVVGHSDYFPGGTR